jgi:signal transduction histidine kinase
MGLFRRHKKNQISQNQTVGAILASIRDGVIIVDPKGKVKYLNPAAAKLINLHPDEAVDLSYASIIHLVNKNGIPAANGNDPIAAVLRTNQLVETKAFDLVKNNLKEATPICLTIAPTTTDPSSPKVITMRNIATELKEEQERSEFISTASHEMRHPVASIEGYLGLALNPQTATIDDRAREYLIKAHESSQHLGKLFRDLLDVTKLDDNKMKQYPVPVEMTELVRSIADSIAPTATAKGLIYNFGQTESSRKIDQVIYCSLDPDYLREILDNLISNAIKYTPSGGTIIVAIAGDEKNAIITVTDTGPGISREHQNHIFQKFYRVDNSETRNTEGTGLGLYIAKQRAEAMQGRLWVESEEGHGSKFFLTFPRISRDEFTRQNLAHTNPMRPQPDNSH